MFKTLKKLTFKAIIFRLLFVALFTTMLLVHLVGQFEGITHKDSLEQAQIGREILRGNGWTTKVHHPAILYISEKNEKNISLLNQHDTYHAPLYPVVHAVSLALINGGDAEKHRVSPNAMVYLPDRIIAATSLLFLLVSIGINYQFAKYLFDKTIASTLAIIMLLSGGIWSFVQSCLPQMFLLMIFSIILYLLYYAFQKYEKTEQTPWRHLLICAILFGVLALTKWLTLWIFIGYLCFILLHFKPKGYVAGFSIGIVGIMIAPFLYLNMMHYGSPFGAASIAIMNGITGEEEYILRNYAHTGIRLDQLFLKILTRCFEQIQSLSLYMSGLIIAPFFFLSLLHNYKRSNHNHLKTGIAVMWLTAVLGMAIFGVSAEGTDTNQLHILFLPIMTMFGISVVALMWNRLSFSRHKTIISQTHIILIIVISTGATLAKIPAQIIETFQTRGRGKNYSPYYHPAELSNQLPKTAREHGNPEQPLILSDQPAAVAWYGDINAIGLPLNANDLEKLDQFALKQNLVISGIHTTAATTKHFYKDKINVRVMPLTNLPYINILTGQNLPISTKILTNQEEWSNIANTFTETKSLVRSPRFNSFGHHVFHGRRNLKSNE